MNEYSINLDSILQEQMKLHGANPHFLRDAALLYQSACHTFKLVDGAYIRGAGPWDGEYSGEARDRVEALRCLVKAMQLAEKDNNMKLLGQLRFITAQALLVKGSRYSSPSPFQAYAALGNLTSLKELPGYVAREEAPPFRNVATVPVTVNAKTGKPEVVFYHASSSWETAKNDGERMRWLLDAAIQVNPELANQVIRPYSDLLLHDMGPGLADERTEFAANGQDWRTAPLWGIGLSETVAGHSQFLHDGRARNLLEAVLWHGGEAQPARDHVLTFNAEQRAALLAFLNSL